MLDAERHRAVGYMLLASLLLTGAFVGVLALLGELERYVRSPLWLVAWFSMAFYISWWGVYYWASDRPGSDEAPDGELAFPDRQVVTLRSFLTYNTPRGRITERGEHLSEKARDTIPAVGVIVGFSLLIFSYTVDTLYTKSPPAHQEAIFTGVLTLQIFALANFLIAIDSLDTTMNEFGSASPNTVHRLKQGFYDRGIGGYYRGLSVLVLSMFLLTMVVSPLVTVIGVAAFAYYGYDYWFGYTNGHDVGEREAS